MRLVIFQSIFNTWRKDRLFNKQFLEQSDIHMKKDEDACKPLPHSIYKIRTKWIRDLYLRAKAVKLLEETEGNFYNPSLEKVL